MDVIATHMNADFDSLASMLAAKKLYPNAVLVFPGSQEKNLRDFFLQSTFYLFETVRIKNIDLKAIQRLILVDTRQPGRIGKFKEILHRPGLELHIYDHHPPSPDDLKGNREFIREVGATVTILTHILKEKKIPLTPEEATVLALGLYEDTGSFTFSSTTVEDLEAAAFLLGQGANLNLVSNLITRELTTEQIALLNELIQGAARYTIKGLEVVIAKASASHYMGDFAVLAHKLKDMENINVLFALAQMEDRIYLVARSRLEEVNVGEIAAVFGGGGHATAASATIRDLNLAQAEEKILNVLEGRIHPIRRAKDLMSFPVKTVAAQETIEKAGELLTRYNVNVLPVMEDEKIVGLVSRQVIEKATFHGFKDSPARDYMTSEFAIVHPQTPLSKVQDLIVDNNQRFLPVMEKETLVGAITRTDLLRWLYSTTARTPHALLEQDFSRLQPRKREILQIMSERLPPEIIRLLKGIGKKGHDLGFQVYAVGGFVRDLILRAENYDIDLVVEGDGIRLAEEFEKKYPCRIRTHKKFGTAIILLPDGLKVDVATARWEFYDSPAALPTVERASIKTDLYRRDFTVNTLAIQLNPKAFGELIDFFGGVKDVKEKVIRVLHNLSFVEDPTRVFRAIRFEQRFGFQIGKHTQNLMKNAVKVGFLERLSGGRVLSEIILILQEEDPLPALKRMRDFNLFHLVHPSLKFDEQAEVLFEQIRHVISWFDLLFLEQRYERWLIYFYGLTDFLKEGEREALCQRLAMNEKLGKRVLEGKLQADRTLLQIFSWINTDRRPKRSEIYDVLDPLSTESKLFMMAKTTQVATRRYISLYFTQLKDTKPLLGGKDLIQMGMKSGPLIKRALTGLLKARLDEQVITRQDEMEYISKAQGVE